jgi:uncharacterized membrane protein YqjE
MDLHSQASVPQSALRSLVGTLTLYAEARLRLVQIESKEAGARLVSLLFIAAIGLGLTALGWLIAVPAIIWLISENLAQPWYLVALVTAVLHLAIGFILLLTLKIKLGRLRLFEDSLNEFQKDRAWLAPQQP